MQKHIMPDLLNTKIIGKQSELIITSTSKIMISKPSHTYPKQEHIGSIVDYTYNIKEGELNGSIRLNNVLSLNQARTITLDLFETEGLYFTSIIFEKDEQKDPTLLPGKHFFKFW